MRADVVARGYALDTATRAMGMAPTGLRVPRPVIDVEPANRVLHARAGKSPPASSKRSTTVRSTLSSPPRR
jgi:hypothetical protein